MILKQLALQENKTVVLRRYIESENVDYVINPNHIINYYLGFEDMPPFM